MSRSSSAKKARRRKRVASRNARWVPSDVHADLSTVEALDAQLTGRGWEFDEEYSTDEFVTWFYPPSAAEFDDEETEPVTRIWVTDVRRPQVILVGSTASDAAYGLDADGLDADDPEADLAGALAEIEGYRAGDPRPF
ncbi:hypothetical protein [Mycolicibacterium grossiae]|uniref:Uncharacterized protein n=1 Tax=Mycolicibacterium grossiae TaxID=1552759 RepID=A0A1E8PYB4_9MYCO|nr:hypothetical protein [Mycolicibacterium grossiae]OFJ51077.1 hypothetical protein BEL07_24665 [Mycolicibacterium grossiae]QEM44918.1 hypothetical protein FZ046_09070 [Mycolicibacterium grossiae]